MSVQNPTNKAASIRQKLLNHAKNKGQDFQRTIDEYATECVLDRLTRSAHASRFLLKGALLFSVWKGLGTRPTRDIDLMGQGESDLDSIVHVFMDIVSVKIDEDGVIFFPDKIEGLRIKEDNEYEGVRVLVPGALSGATFKVQIDIGFGDAVTPPPVMAAFPRMLDMRPFSLLTYPPETVFAEKLDAIVIRGIVNSRMKDYYDMSILIREGMIQPDAVRRAVENTFKRRKTLMPASCPVGLSQEFVQEPTKIAQWKGFLKKSGLNADELPDIIALIRDFTEQVFPFWKNKKD